MPVHPVRCSSNEETKSKYCITLQSLKYEWTLYYSGSDLKNSYKILIALIMYKLVIF